MRSFRSRASGSVVPPTLISAAPPTSRRSRSSSCPCLNVEFVSAYSARISLARASSSALLVAPPMMVVFSLSTTICFARPRSASVASRELDARFFADDAAAGLRREVAQVGRAPLAITGGIVPHTFIVPCSLFTTSSDIASPITSRDDQQRPPRLRDLLEDRHQIGDRR